MAKNQLRRYLWKEKIPPTVVNLVNYVIAQNWQGRHVRFAEEYNLTPSWMSDLCNGKKSVGNLSSLDELATAISQDARDLKDQKYAARLSKLLNYKGLLDAATELFPEKREFDSHSITITLRKSQLYWLLFALSLPLILFLLWHFGGLNDEHEPPVVLTDSGIVLGTAGQFRTELAKAKGKPRELAREHFSNAQNLYAKGAFAEAAIEYKNSLEEFPTVATYLNWGAALFKMAQHDSAARVWQTGLDRARKTKVQDAEILQSALSRNIALCYEANGNMYEALLHLRQAEHVITNKRGDKAVDSYTAEVLQRIFDTVVASYLKQYSSPHLPNKFANALEAAGIEGAKPFDNGGGAGPHLWGPLWVQDFKNEEKNLWYIAVYNSHTDEIVFLEGALRNFWLTNNGVMLGPPIGDRMALSGPYLCGNAFEFADQPQLITVWIFGNPDGDRKTIVRNERTGEYNVTPVGQIILEGGTGHSWFVRSPATTGENYSDKLIATVGSHGLLSGWVEPGHYPILVRKRPDGQVDATISRMIEEGDYAPAKPRQ